MKRVLALFTLHPSLIHILNSTIRPPATTFHPFDDSGLLPASPLLPSSHLATYSDNHDKDATRYRLTPRRYCSLVQAGTKPDRTLRGQMGWQ